jgi:hypothetical protein
MTEHHDDDKKLVNFLRQNRPQIPPTSPKLEDKIIYQISQYPENTRSRKIEKFIYIFQIHRRFLYFFSPVIAVGIIIFISSNHLLTPQKPSESEISKIEDFMENNWHDTLTDKPENYSTFDN